MLAEHLVNAIGWLLSVVTAVGNGFVVFLITRNRRLHFPANWFILSLAVADFGVGVAVYPSSFLCNYSKACNLKVYVAVFWFFLHSSVTNLCVLTWDRYSAIVHSLRYITFITVRRPARVILVAWLIPFVISLTLLVEMYAIKYHTAQKVLRLICVSAFNIISCLLLFYAVVRMLAVARARYRQEKAMALQIQSSLSSPMETVTSHRRKRQSTSIIAIVVFYLGCYGVVNFLVLCMTFSCQMPERAGQILIILLVLNSAVNPLVYAFLKKDIKKEIKRLIRR